MNNTTVKTSSNTTTQATAPQATPSFDTWFVKLCEQYTLQLARTRDIH